VQVHPPTGKLLVLCCGRAKETVCCDEAGDPRPRRSDEPWQDTLRCVDPVTGAPAAAVCTLRCICLIAVVEVSRMP